MRCSEIVRGFMKPPASVLMLPRRSRIFHVSIPHPYRVLVFYISRFALGFYSVCQFCRFWCSYCCYNQESLPYYLIIESGPFSFVALPLLYYWRNRFFIVLHHSASPLHPAFHLRVQWECHVPQLDMTRNSTNLHFFDFIPLDEHHSRFLRK